MKLAFAGRRYQVEAHAVERRVLPVRIGELDVAELDVAVQLRTVDEVVAGRPLDDPEPLMILEALLELTDQAGDAFLTAHKRLQERERRFQRAERRGRGTGSAT